MWPRPGESHVLLWDRVKVAPSSLSSLPLTALSSYVTWPVAHKADGATSLIPTWLTSGPSGFLDSTGLVQLIELRPHGGHHLHQLLLLSHCNLQSGFKGLDRTGGLGIHLAANCIALVLGQMKGLLDALSPPVWSSPSMAMPTIPLLTLVKGVVRTECCLSFIAGGLERRGTQDTVIRVNVVTALY